MDQIQKYRLDNVELMEVNFSGYSEKEICSYIEESSSAYALSLIVTSPHRKSGITYLYDLLSSDNSASKQVMAGKACIKPVIEKLTGESRSSIRTLLKHLNEKASKTEPPIL